MKDGKQTYTDITEYELGEYLKSTLKPNDNPITASVNYLHSAHTEMFENRRHVDRTIRNVLNSIPEIVKQRDYGSYYIAKSLKNEQSNIKSQMQDAVIEPLPNENYIKHLNLKDYNKDMREAMNKLGDSKDVPPPTHQSKLAATLDESTSNNHLGSKSHFIA